MQHVKTSDLNLGGNNLVEQSLQIVPRPWAPTTDKEAYQTANMYIYIYIHIHKYIEHVKLNKMEMFDGKLFFQPHVFFCFWCWVWVNQSNSAKLCEKSPKNCLFSKT